MSRSALFVGGAPGDTRRYRVHHQAEALRLAGWTVRTLALEERSVWERAEIGPVDVIVLHRVPWSDGAARAVEAARRSGGTILFDTDDLVFAPVAEARFAALRAIHAERQGPGFDPAAAGFAAPERYLETLLACDGCLAASPPIAEAVIALGRAAEVVPNAIDLEMLRLSTRARSAATRIAGPGEGEGEGKSERDGDGEGKCERDGDGDERVIVGYASGTATHARDLAIAVPALRALLADDPRVVLRLMGHMEVETAWALPDRQVERVPFVDWRRLPAELARLDIAIAPLDVDDVFARAKSELKFIEAGAVGVPIVASPIPAFRAAIDHGLTGLLASTDDGWRAALGQLVDDTPGRRSMGAAAAEAVLDGWVTDVRGARLEAAIERLGGGASPSRAPARLPVRVAGPTPAAPRRADDPPGRADDLSARTGDASQSPRSSEPGMARVIEAAVAESRAATARRPAAGAVDFGLSDGDAPAEIEAGGPVVAPRLPVALGVGDLLAAVEARDDAAGSDPGALGADARYEPRDGEGMPVELLLLDGEPTVGRHAMGSELVLAARALSGLAGRPHSLGEGADPVPTAGFGPWLPAWLAHTFGTPARPGLPYPIDRSIFGPGIAPAERAPIVAMEIADAPYRPDPALGLATLERVGVLAGDAERVVFTTAPFDGHRAAAVVAAAIGARFAGQLDDAALADLLRRAAALIVPSCASPPLRALQAMACGCAVVAPDVGAVRWLFVNGQTAATAPPHEDALARAAVAVVRDGAVRERIAAGASAMVERMSTGRAVAALEGAHLPPATGAPVVDRLQAHADEHPGLALDDGHTAGQSFTARMAGLSRIDVRLRRVPDGAGRLEMTLRTHPTAVETLAVAEHAGPFETGEWLAFEFEPLVESAGRAFHAEWSWSPGGGRGAPELEALAVDAFAGGRTTRDGQVDPARTLAFRTWCRPPVPEPTLGAREIDRELVDTLLLLARAEIAVQRDVRLLEGGWPFRLAAWLSPSPPPLPPFERRPWPPDAALHVKLAGTLAHFGPAALVREFVAFGRWRGLSDTERDAARGLDRAGRGGEER